MKNILQKRYLELFAAFVFVVGGVGIGAISANPALAAPRDVFQTGACKDSILCSTDDNTKIMGVLSTVIKILFWVGAVVSVIMIIIGGILYMVAAGDPGKITKAKNTVLYSIIGLVVTLLAFSIVYFVTDLFK
ncbi:hypothetical protein EOL73_02285 [Candidatus Saccharibacteria bacterium]|nr:hypothetical protein [Candidatus Saccharibacteria bacterium]NCU40564.1 hypothetical protein [Candidatus Saccharibacteria bacterium]